MEGPGLPQKGLLDNAAVGSGETYVEKRWQGVPPDDLCRKKWRPGVILSGICLARAPLLGTTVHKTKRWVSYNRIQNCQRSEHMSA